MKWKSLINLEKHEKMATEVKKQLAVGDTLWLVYNEKRRGNPREIVVSKVGRKWIYFDDGRSRFDLETKRVDAGVYSSSATIYESKEVYDKEVSLCLLWQKLYRHMEGRYRAPIKGLTEDAINQAAKLLGLWE